MEGVPVQSQAGGSRPPSAVRRAVSTANRLANLVRGHGVTCRIPVDTAFHLEASAQRSRYALAPGQQSISQCAAALHPRAVVSLRVRTARRQSMVETRTNR